VVTLTGAGTSLTIKNIKLAGGDASKETPANYQYQGGGVYVGAGAELIITNGGEISGNIAYMEIPAGSAPAAAAVSLLGLVLLRATEKTYAPHGRR
jgi:hypothetical protein